MNYEPARSMYFWWWFDDHIWFCLPAFVGALTGFAWGTTLLG